MIAEKYGCRFVDNETPYEIVPQGHPTIVLMLAAGAMSLILFVSGKPGTTGKGGGKA